MNEETTCSRDSSCGSARSSVAVSIAGAGAAFTGEVTAALCATTHNEQCEAGDVCPATASCTWTACTNPKPAITRAKNTAVHFWNSWLLNWCFRLITTTVLVSVSELDARRELSEAETGSD